MGFPDIQQQKFIDAMDQMIASNGSTATVTLRDGTIFTLRAVERGQNPNDRLTDGMSERRASVTFMARRWSDKAPANRDPEKGDQFTINGRRRAISSVEIRAIDDVRVGWICRFEG